MYKILNSQGLGVGGRQNELIELALTYGFNGVEVDMEDLVGRHDALGKQFACQFLQSAETDMGTFCLTAKLGGTEAEYQASVAKLDTIVDLATTLGAKQCYIRVQPTNANFAVQENFDQHQVRLQEIGAKFEPHGIRVGVALQASSIKLAEGEHKFIQTAEEILALVKTVGQANVGICLDCWEWVVGGGTLEQLQAIDAKKLLTEVRLADVAEGVDLKTATKKDRTALPGDNKGSFSFALAQHLIAEGFEGPMSVSTALATFDEEVRETVVEGLSQRLDQIIAGDDPSDVPVVETPEGETPEGETPEGESAAEDNAVAAGTES